MASPGPIWVSVAELHFHTTAGLFVSIGAGTVPKRLALEIVTVRGDRLAQSEERAPLDLMVVGSSPTLVVEINFKTLTGIKSTSQISFTGKIQITL